MSKIKQQLKIPIKIPFLSVISALKIAFVKWYDKDPFHESAVIAYYAIFSLPGLLVIIITLAGYFFGVEAVNNKVADQFTATMGAQTALQIQDMIVQASKLKNSLLATLIGIVTILVGATGVFAQFQRSLNEIWEVKIDPLKSSSWNTIRVRLFSFGLIVSIAFLLMVSLLVSTLLAAFGNWLSGHFSDSILVVMQFINSAFSLGIMAVLFALMFKILPDANIQWKHVWIGSFVTAFLFEIGKFGLGLYFGKAHPGTGYGAAGSVILIMLWVSYTSMIVFFGAEFTHAYSNLFPGKVQPSEIATTEKTVKKK